MTKTHRVCSYLMYVLCMSCRSENGFNPLYILVVVEGRAQYNQPLRPRDCHPVINVPFVASSEFKRHGTIYAPQFRSSQI